MAAKDSEFESLETVAKAAAIRSSVELRSEAIACLALTDVRFRDLRRISRYENEFWDPNLDRARFLRAMAGRSECAG